MKFDKKVIESVMVAGIALALTITAVTGNGVKAADQVAETQMDKNGMAGVAVAMNAYELEAADMLDSIVSVEKSDSNIVAASAEDTTYVSDTPVESDTSEGVETEPQVAVQDSKDDKELSDEEKEWNNKLMADVDEFLYVRKSADADSEIVGKMYKGDRAVIKDEGSEWTKIASGNVKGYVKNDYCVTGQKAYAYAKKNCKTVAKVEIDGLRIRKKASTDAGVVKTVASGDKLVVNTKADAKDGWVAVKVDSQTCYVSEDYVTVALKTGKAITIEEEIAAQKEEEERKAKEEAAKQEAAKKSAQSASSSSSASNGQTTTTSSSQGTSLTASADDETLLAALIQCEAGGQSQQCMIAVGAVVVNRVHSGSFASSIRGVIYQRGQFGPASSGRLESRLASGVSASARQAAQAALAGNDPTGGAKYFKLASSGHAGVVIGPIVFY